MKPSWLASKIEQWPIANLVPYARNARVHSARQVAQIAASIAEFGFTNPILAGSDGIIIAGHGRLEAAQKIGLELVPVVVIDHLTPTQRKALVIADNRITDNAAWDDAMLRLELDYLLEEGFDLDIVGFDAGALADLDAPDGGYGDATPTDMPELPSGDKPEFQQMTFTLHDSQAEQVRMAMDVADGFGEYIGSPNANSNGNALARICETYVTQNGNG